MTLGTELDQLLENSSESQKTRFKELFEDVKKWGVPSENKPVNDRFLAQILFRKELKEGRV